jgi:hypothetical protein
MREVSTVPTWTGEQGEHLMYISGTTRRLYLWDDVNSAWLFIEFNNSGRGQSTIVNVISATGQGAAITTKTLFTPSANGLFRVSVYMCTTTTGTGTLTCTIGWSDDQGARTVQPASSVDLSGNNASTGSTFIEAVNGVAITYATAIAGIAGSPKYSLYIVCEQMA